MILHDSERIFYKEDKNLIMLIDDKIRDEKLRQNINRKAAKASALSYGNLISIDILQVKKYYLLIKVE